VSPARFIPVLEETGMVVEVGEWAIREACKQHRTWIDAGLPPIRIAVNLSARQLREISFVSVLQKVLHEAGVGPEGIEIEITESMIMSDTDSAIAALTELHGLGVRVAMDDFGTGYSSLSYLRKFPIDTIKIDGSFVADISTSADDAEIVRTIISMGQTLNKTIVAEGVETEEQLQLLRNFKCDQVQGYLFSRPVPGNELTEFIRETNR
jgi:EAL domain-containing protein (putative c-di-GMP-specific phosphodiesterase class I)